MTLIISKGLHLRKTWQPMDPDAAAYIAAVETADTEPLEEKTKIAIDNFVLGCKSDGTWTAIKASCILAGARTLTGALVPLVGTAPTNFNFVAGDYNRKTGLVGNGSTKLLDSNRANNVDPQDNFHISVQATTVAGAGYGIASRAEGALAGRTLMAIGDLGIQTNRQASAVTVSTPVGPGFVGQSRSNSSSFNLRRSGATASISQASENPSGDPTNLLVYSRGLPSSPAGPTSSRIAFYSIGESLNLALLDARVTDLINAFAAAIP
jgi:hypothetical protein